MRLGARRLSRGERGLDAAHGLARRRQPVARGLEQFKISNSEGSRTPCPARSLRDKVWHPAWGVAGGGYNAGLMRRRGNRFRTRRPGALGEARFELVPLLDCVFQLLIFSMYC